MSLPFCSAGDYTLPLDEEHIDYALEPTRLLAEQIGYFELERFASDLLGGVDSLVFGDRRYGGAPIPSNLATEPITPERLRAFVATYGLTLGKLAADPELARLARDVAAAASSEARFPTGRAQLAAGLWNRYTATPYPRMEVSLRRFAIAS